MVGPDMESSFPKPYLIQEKDVEGALERLDNVGITLPGSEAEAAQAVIGLMFATVGSSLIDSITRDMVKR